MEGPLSKISLPSQSKHFILLDGTGMRPSLMLSRLGLTVTCVAPSMLRILRTRCWDTRSAEAVSASTGVPNRQTEKYISLD